MNKIFIEAKNNKTPEYYFLQTIINKFFQNKNIEFIFMDGIGNLYNEAILNQIRLAQEDREQVLVLADADTKEKGSGYKKRKIEIENGMTEHNVSFHYFLYPDNKNDGDVENLMENAARHDLHAIFFDCFEDYEKCVSGVKNDSGEPMYNVPNLKGKLHTYITAQKLSQRLRKKLGSGNWLFDDTMYWNLNVDALQPLKDFFATNLI